MTLTLCLYIYFILTSSWCYVCCVVEFPTTFHCTVSGLLVYLGGCRLMIQIKMKMKSSVLFYFCELFIGYFHFPGELVKTGCVTCHVNSTQSVMPWHIALMIWTAMTLSLTSRIMTSHPNSLLVNGMAATLKARTRWQLDFVWMRLRLMTMMHQERAKPLVV